LATSACILSTMACGVPLGAAMPNQLVAVKSSSPA